MSTDFLNQLTLSCLISKDQLQKLNNNNKKKKEAEKNQDILKWGTKIEELFLRLSRNDIPDDLLCDVQTAYDHYVDKCIYYFKTQEENNNIHIDDNIKDDIDYDREDANIISGNYEECDNKTNEDDI